MLGKVLKPVLERRIQCIFVCLTISNQVSSFSLSPTAPCYFGVKLGLHRFEPRRSLVPKMNFRSFRTEISVPESENKIQSQDGITLIGSCFAENMGQRLRKLKFNVDVNPFGIVFNPISIQRCLDCCLSSTFFEPHDLHYNGALGTWYSWDHHSCFSLQNQEETLDGINKRLSSARTHLRQSKWLFITLGTAWAYELKEGAKGPNKKSKLVANCHKMPQSLFNKRLLGVEEIVSSLGSTLDQLSEINSEIKIIFTISPVRHWKDGPIENMRSKAHLLTAMHELKDTLKFSQNVGYFPAYEIMMDDLRDYRFYDEDMLHPSSQAVEYIWDKFIACFFQGETLETTKQISKVHQAMKHKPFHFEGPAHQKFVRKQLKVIDELACENPSMDFSIEKEFFLNYLI